MTYKLGAFAALDQRLTDAIFAQYAEPVTLEPLGGATLETEAVVDRNVAAFSPYQHEVVEPIIAFEFRYTVTGDIPTRSIITCGADQFEVDQTAPTASHQSGRSEDDGSTIKVIARPL